MCCGRTLEHLCVSFLVLVAIIGKGADPYGLNERAPLAPFLNGRLPPTEPAGEWAVEKAFANLTFPDPIGFVAAGTNLFYVYCRGGQIYFCENDPNATSKTLFLDISERTQGWDDCGLLGMAFHPEFGRAGSTNRGYFYVFYQYSDNPTTGPDRPPRQTPSFNRLSRFTVPDGATVADLNSELVLIDQYDEDLWHNGGSMFFHPEDRFLYLSLGDEGGLAAEYGNTQLINKGLFSGVIRIDVDCDPTRSHPIRRQPVTEAMEPLSGTAHYYIPNDNPFLDSGGSVLEEFLCIGLRSPHRMSCDPVTGQIWLGDVGSVLREEVNLIEKGGNYQWAYKEGNQAGPIPQPSVIIGMEKPPVYAYSRANGDITVIGGYVYRGASYAAELGGKYIFGDNGSGRIWALTPSTLGSPSITYLCSMPSGFGYGGLASFGVDQEGELYMVKMGPQGQIFKLVRPPPVVRSAPLVLSQTGAFTNLQNLWPAPGLIPFGVNSPLWSDGTIKSRWMGLPNDGAPYLANERVTFSPTSEWGFPDGTVFLKHFELAIDETNPSLRKRLETRFLVRDTNGLAYGLTYKWRPDDSDADLLDEGVSEELTRTLVESVGFFSDSVDIGAPRPGSTTYHSADDMYTIVAGGADIWGTADQFRFVYQRRSGDFDIKVRVESLELVDGYTKAGLMARASLAASSPHVDANVFADNRQRGSDTTGYEFIFREALGGSSAAAAPATPSPQVAYPNTWLRLKRQGDEFTAYASSNGVTWMKYAVKTLALPSPLYFGMAVTSHDNSRTTTATFRSFAHNLGQVYSYPSRHDCMTCHTPLAGHVLGPRTDQLNGPWTYSDTGITDNQLRTWNHLELFNEPPIEEAIPNLPKLVAVTNTSASLEARARSYLAANCAHCHRPNGVARANWDARYETPLANQNIIDGQPTESFGISGARVVAPGNLGQSILHRRINNLGTIKMPPLARNTIDPDGVATLGQWINSLADSRHDVGLRSEYYDNADLTGLKLTRADEVIHFDWAYGSPDPAINLDTFSIRWTGELQPRYTETYTFHTTSDDGVRLWVGDQLIIDNWTDHPPTEDTGTIALVAGRKYPLRLEYYEKSQAAQVRLAWSSPSQAKELVPASQLSPSSFRWLDRDIGSVGRSGLATYANGNITNTASGRDIWDQTDAFHYAYRPLVGAGEIVARVASLGNSHPWAKAGVMIRATLDADSPHALLAITAGNGAAFQRRLVAGDLSLHTTGPFVRTPHWVRLTRNGDAFRGSISPDGVNWTLVGSATIQMSARVFMGVAVTAHDDSTSNTALFTDAAVTLFDFPAPVMRSIKLLNNGQVQIDILATAEGDYALQASQGLQEWWTVEILARTNGAISFVDTQMPNERHRFYRIAAEP